MYLLPEGKRQEIWSAYGGKGDIERAAAVLFNASDDGVYKHTFSALRRNWLKIKALEAEDNVIIEARQYLREERGLLNKYGQSEFLAVKNASLYIDYFQGIVDSCVQKCVGKVPSADDEQRLTSAREYIMQHKTTLGSLDPGLVQHVLNSRSKKAELTAKLKPYDLELYLQRLTSRQDKIEALIAPIEGEVFDALEKDGVEHGDTRQLAANIVRIIGKKCLDLSVARFNPTIVVSDVDDVATRVSHSATLSGCEAGQMHRVG